MKQVNEAVRERNLRLLTSVLVFLLCIGCYILYFSRLFFFLLTASRTLFVTTFTYLVIYLLMCRIYGGFQLGSTRNKQMLFGMGISLFITDLAANLMLSIMNVTVVHDGDFVFESPLRLFFVYLTQLLIILLIDIGGNALYYHRHKPQTCLVITEAGVSHNRLVKELSRDTRHFRVTGIVDRADPTVTAMIADADCVFFYGVSVENRCHLVEYCYRMRKTIYYSMEISDLVALRGRHTNFDDMSFILSPEFQLSAEARFTKRFMDIVVSSLGLIICSPIFLATAVAIRLEDRGPVFYKQARATEDGKSFKVIKFRSMRSEVGGIHKSVQKDDDRITHVGHFIRKFRIDELPQLINVLRGDMSLVGPRPEMWENVEKYTQDLPEFSYRLKMKAGLTGLAQIYGRYNTSPKDKLLMDMVYIEQYSLRMDIILLFRTVLVLLTPEESTQAFETEEKN